MTKPGRNSTLDRLTPEQQARLNQWLFQEKRTYKEVTERCQSELGMRLSRSVVGRYFNREWARWELKRVAGATGSCSAHEDAERKFTEALARLTDYLLEQSRNLDSDRNCRVVKELTSLLIAARREQSQALRAATKREEFEIDIATACLVHHVQMQAFCDDESLDDAQRVMKIRQELFGPVLPD